MKIKSIRCDACGIVLTPEIISNLHWDNRPSVFKLDFPRDGVNGGHWEMDVCAGCREGIYDAITDKITELKHKP